MEVQLQQPDSTVPSPLHPAPQPTPVGALEAPAVPAEVTRLDREPRELLLELADLGEVRLVTRNVHASHAVVGEYRNLLVSGNHARLLDGSLELELSLNQCRQVFAVRSHQEGRLREGLHFFNARGIHVHSLLLTTNSDRFAFRALSGAHHAAHRRRPQANQPTPSPRRQPAQHCFNSSTAGFSRPLHPGAFHELLQALADVDLGISLSVGSTGATQTHRGALHSVERNRDWLRIRDGAFDLAVSEQHISSARLRSQESALDVFGPTGERVVTLGGPPATDHDQQQAWQQILAALPSCAFTQTSID